MIIGILGAMREEIDPLLSHFRDTREHHIGGNIFYECEHNGTKVFIAYSKIGKVHSTMTTTLLLSHFKAQSVLFSGVAGSLGDLRVNDLIVASKVCQHDVDLSAFGHPLGFFPESSVFLESSEKLNKIAYRAARELGLKLHSGVIASGDEFIHSKERKTWIHETFGAEAVDMESACVGVACVNFGVPFCILRTISDDTEGQAEISFDEFLASASEMSAKLTFKMVDLLSAS